LPAAALQVGTMSHMPPELLRYGRMSCAVDIYAFGVMMWELFTREVAFRELHYGQVGLWSFVLLWHSYLLCGALLRGVAQCALPCLDRPWPSHSRAHRCLSTVKAQQQHITV
jgi:serine/threonine protein kinase